MGFLMIFSPLFYCRIEFTDQMAFGMLKKLFCAHDDKAEENGTNGETDETNKTDYVSIAKKSNDGIQERKKEYAKNLGDWIEAYVKDNLDSKALKAAKRGVTKFKLCTFESEKYNWYGKTLWVFSNFEMKGNSKFLYDYYKKESRYDNPYYQGDFFDVRTYLKERYQDYWKNQSFTLKFDLNEDTFYDDFTYSIIVTMK